jgi:hypothetical protein
MLQFIPQLILFVFGLLQNLLKFENLLFFSGRNFW